MKTSEPEFDVVVFGATSFVGQILCRYMLARHGAQGELRWAMAGRSKEKLESLRDTFGQDGASVPLIIADAKDDPALHRMCARTRVVASTVGPYTLYGESLVSHCAQSGTDYCDLTGEVPWIRQMIDRHEQTAQASGARIIHACGFDSIPSDLGVLFLQREAAVRFGRPCEQIKMRVKAIRGGVSGGTVASMLQVVKLASSDRELRRALADPYFLCPSDAVAKVPQPNVTGPSKDPDFNAWCAPFVMAGINTRIVHRSNALQGYRYGKDFVYDEATLTQSGTLGWLSALGSTVGLGSLLFGLSFSPTRWILSRFVLPNPGEGPSPQAQDDGHYDLHFLGTITGGEKVLVRVTGDRDPGYGSTARILGEAAACLAMNLPKSALRGGFWTPSTAFDEHLIQRLQANAGLKFEVLEI